MAFTVLDALSAVQALQNRRLSNIDIKNMGIMVFKDGRLVPLGQYVSQYTVEKDGIRIKNAYIVIPGGCGHLIKELEDMCGFCMVCKKIICSRPGCLEACDETGVTVCRRCRVVTRDGRIVARPQAKKLNSRLKALRGPKKKETDSEKE
jgi:hypothetical protein